MMVKKVAMTLDIKENEIENYIKEHQQVWPEVRSALHEVGLRNLSLWVWENRLFYYAEYVGEAPFEEAMARYAKMPKIKDWEERMHRYQKQLPGSKGDVWWQPCRMVFNLE